MFILAQRLFTRCDHAFLNHFLVCHRLQFKRQTSTHALIFATDRRGKMHGLFSSLVQAQSSRCRLFSLGLNCTQALRVNRLLIYYLFACLLKTPKGNIYLNRLAV